MLKNGPTLKTAPIAKPEPTPYYLLVQRGTSSKTKIDAEKTQLFRGPRSAALAAADKMEIRLNDGITAADCERNAIEIARKTGNAAVIAATAEQTFFVTVLTTRTAERLPGFQDWPCNKAWLKGRKVA